MSKKCARCEKTVYPTEELKCLDKIWHKPCFKCKECGMALNMRNYKGFDKEPYCDAHIPKAKATTMAETPELKRIAENTKIQSNVKYHADFEKSKGKFTQVADDPETLRIKQNTKIISNVAYHGDIQRKAEMEQKRHVNENGHPVVAMAPPLPPPNTQVTSSHGSLGQQQQNHHQQQQMSNTSSMSNNTSSSMMINAEKNSNMAASVSLTHHQQSMMAAAASAAPPYQPPPPIIPASTGGATGGPTTLPAPQHNSIGKISDYEPNSGNYASPYSSRNSQTLIYSSEAGSVNNPPPQRQIGSVHDMDPLNHNYGSLGRVYRAMYDYEAQDVDEVSFQDGDLIVNVRSIDGGWMTGEVQRTGQVGMLPANYVQLVNI